MTIEIGKVEIKISEEVKVDLTLEQVKELRDALLELVPVDPTVIREYYPTLPYRPWRHWDFNYPDWYTGAGAVGSGTTLGQSVGVNAQTDNTFKLELKGG